MVSSNLGVEPLCSSFRNTNRWMRRLTFGKLFLPTSLKWLCDPYKKLLSPSLCVHGTGQSGINSMLLTHGAKGVQTASTCCLSVCSLRRGELLYFCVSVPSCLCMCMGLSCTLHGMMAPWLCSCSESMIKYLYTSFKYHIPQYRGATSHHSIDPL